MRTRLRRLPLLAWIALLGCASAPEPEYGSKYDPLERFPASGLWAWDERANVLPEGPRFEGLDLEPALRAAIADALADRGYREGSDAAHYRVSYQLGIGTRIRPEESVAVGSLSLLFTEVRTRRPVWVGFARAELDVNRSQAERNERLRAIVAEMLAAFPPGHED